MSEGPDKRSAHPANINNNQNNDKGFDYG